MTYFTNAELLSIESSAQGALIGPNFDEGHWLGLVIDLSRELRRQQQLREHQ